MTEVDSAKPEKAKFEQTIDHGSATSAMIVGSVFIVILGTAVLIGSFFRQHPFLMSVLTIAAIVWLYIWISK